MRPPRRPDVVQVVDHAYALLQSNDEAAADHYLRQCVHIGFRPCDILIEATKREPLET